MKIASKVTSDGRVSSKIPQAFEEGIAGTKGASRADMTPASMVGLLRKIATAFLVVAGAALVALIVIAATVASPAGLIAAGIILGVTVLGSSIMWPLIAVADRTIILIDGAAVTVANAGKVMEHFANAQESIGRTLQSGKKCVLSVAHGAQRVVGSAQNAAAKVIGKVRHVMSFFNRKGPAESCISAASNAPGAFPEIAASRASDHEDDHEDDHNALATAESVERTPISPQIASEIPAASPQERPLSHDISIPQYSFRRGSPGQFAETAKAPAEHFKVISPSVREELAGDKILTQDFVKDAIQQLPRNALDRTLAHGRQQNLGQRVEDGIRHAVGAAGEKAASVVRAGWGLLATLFPSKRKGKVSTDS